MHMKTSSCNTTPFRSTVHTVQYLEVLSLGGHGEIGGHYEMKLATTHSGVVMTISAFWCHGGSIPAAMVSLLTQVTSLLTPGKESYRPRNLKVRSPRYRRSEQKTCACLKRGRLYVEPGRAKCGAILFFRPRLLKPEYY